MLGFENLDDPGEPLQVVNVDLKTNDVVLVPESIQKLQDNLKKAGVEKISVVSIMGAYRTGKSFLLDLMIRYLSAPRVTEDKQEPREKGLTEGAFKPPQWLLHHGDMRETRNEEERPRTSAGPSIGGFNWRGGQARCTEGMWIWSTPFVQTTTVEEKTINGDDEEIITRRKVKVGVLLMDTQGAFDSETTKKQSAALFGMTTAISSKQIYNLQGRLGSDTLEHLHYFAEMAVSAIRTGSTTSEHSNEAPFKHLQFLVRDWPNFDDETFDDEPMCKKYRVNRPTGERWTEEHCVAQAKAHRDQHMGPDVKERNTVDMLEQMFQRIELSLLPSPGQAVAESRKRWNGDVASIDEDFLRSVDRFCSSILSGNVVVQGILGQDLSPDTFPHVFSALIEAFKGLEVSKMSMVEAIGKAKNLVAKDESYKRYRKCFFDLVKKEKGLSPEVLVQQHKTFYDEAVASFLKEATFGDREAIEDSRIQLEKTLAELYVEVQQENDRILERALSAFAGISSIALILFVLDRASDFGCDWWSDTCVAFSKMFLLTYSSILAVVGFHAYKVARERGKTAAGLAAIELGKNCLKCMTSYVDNVKYYAINREELKEIVVQLFTQVTDAVKAKED